VRRDRAQLLLLGRGVACAIRTGGCPAPQVVKPQPIARAASGSLRVPAAPRPLQRTATPAQQTLKVQAIRGIRSAIILVLCMDALQSWCLEFMSGLLSPRPVVSHAITEE
jgi:hypothetical protein